MTMDDFSESEVIPVVFNSFILKKRPPISSRIPDG